MSPHPRFPADFTWGAATASYQIEGAVKADGRGQSIWDTFCAEPGRVRDGHTGDVACDHYHRWPEDVQLMAGLGLDSYRFSVAWPRIQPDGSGPVNGRGLDFYDRLVDALVERGIKPAVTLYHWDLPQRLEDAGGWLNRDTAYRFADYAAVVSERLADRVDLWMTLNEPCVVTVYGYGLGYHAPGRDLMLGALPTAHHQLLGHGLGVAALRSAGARRIAIVNNYSPTWPASDSAEDRAAADAYDALHNRLFTDPVLLARYPDMSAFEDVDMSFVHGDDLAVISAPIDALGVNYYMPTRLAAPDATQPLPFELRPIDGVPITAFGWPVVPDGMRETLMLLDERYGDALPPIYITENGCSYDNPDDPVEDAFRSDYLDGHLRAVRAAMDDGIDVRGYFAWSLMDNFEWAEGYHQRFGLVHVDFNTRIRTPRTSYEWYRDVIAASRAAAT